MNDLPTPEQTKESFYNVSLVYHSDEHILKEISRNAGADIMLKMIKGIAVRRADAEKVLAAFSAYVGRTWNLDNAEVVLMPTFKEVCEAHQLNVDDISGPDKIHTVIIMQMLNGSPVLSAYAEKVLSTLSAHVGKPYTLETVDVIIMNTEAEV